MTDSPELPHETRNGMLVFTGTMVPIDALFRHIAAGGSVETFPMAFPDVTADQARETLVLAFKLLEAHVMELTRQEEAKAKKGE